jgi:hypothetical protein
MFSNIFTINKNISKPKFSTLIIFIIQIKMHNKKRGYIFITMPEITASLHDVVGTHITTPPIL